MQIDKNGMTNDMMMKIYEVCLTGYTARYTTILQYKILPQVGILTTSCRDIIIIIIIIIITALSSNTEMETSVSQYRKEGGSGRDLL